MSDRGDLESETRGKKGTPNKYVWKKLGIVENSIKRIAWKILQKGLLCLSLLVKGQDREMAKVTIG